MRRWAMLASVVFVVGVFVTGIVFAIDAGEKSSGGTGFVHMGGAKKAVEELQRSGASGEDSSVKAPGQ